MGHTLHHQGLNLDEQLLREERRRGTDRRGTTRPSGGDEG